MILPQKSQPKLLQPKANAKRGLLACRIFNGRLWPFLIPQKNRSKSGFFLFQIIRTSSGCLFGDFIGLAFAIGYKHIATAPHGLQIAGVAIVFFNQFSQARKLYIQAAIEGLV